MKTSLGLDISKDTFNGYYYNEKIEKDLKFDNNQAGFNQLHVFLQNQKDTSDLYVTMENTGTYHLKLAVYLTDLGYKVAVVNPTRIKNYAKMKMLRTKTDKLDAKTIAQFGSEQPFSPFKPNSLQSYKLRYYLQAIDDLKKVRTQFICQLEALGTIPFDMSDIISEWNGKIESFDASIKDFEKKISEIISEHYQQEYKCLNSIPGIGKRLVPIILAYFGCFESFEHSKQAAAYIGINPRVCESGTSVHKSGHISKQGNRYIRKMFYMASLSAARFNHQCLNLAKRLKEKNKPTKVIYIAVANKLLRQVFAIVKYKRIYHPDYISVYPKENIA